MFQFIWPTPCRFLPRSMAIGREGGSLPGGYLEAAHWGCFGRWNGKTIELNGWWRVDEWGFNNHQGIWCTPKTVVSLQTMTKNDPDTLGDFWTTTVSYSIIAGIWYIPFLFSQTSYDCPQSPLVRSKFAQGDRARDDLRTGGGGRWCTVGLGDPVFPPQGSRGVLVKPAFNECPCWFRF